jgi:molybdate transport system substrate-binding protein
MRSLKLLLTALVLTSCTDQKQGQQPITLYCAAGLAQPLQEIAAAYQKRFGIPVEIQSGASQTLLASLQVTGLGDLYLPADDSYLADAETKQLVTKRIELASQQAVVVCTKAMKLSSFAELATVPAALPSAESAAIGKLTRAAVGEPAWEAAVARGTSTATVTEAANALKAGSVKAALIWQPMLAQYPQFVALPCAQVESIRSKVSVGLLRSSKVPARAMHFARFLSAKDQGLAVLSKHSFQVVEGDPWEDQPELTVYSGSMLRPAIESTLAQFEREEGVRVTRVYNGCGILVGQMKAGKKPDAYFACDSEFMAQVQESFQSADSIAQNQLVILVSKGNPLGIADLKDLAKPGVRLGIGHEKQCAMGWITQKTFTESGLTEEVMKNVTVQTPTGDMLVNQMLAGSLDAAVTYLSNAVGAADKLDAVRIQGIKCSIATQPFAIWKETPHQQLAARLHATLRSDPSKARFENEGFQWQASKP